MSQKILLLIFILIQIIIQIKSSFSYKKNSNLIIYPNILKLLSSLNINKNKTRLTQISKLRQLLTDEDGEEEEEKSDEENRDNIVPTVLFELFDAFAFFLYKYNLTQLLEYEEVETCFFDGMLESVGNLNLVNIWIDGSGKSLNDFGNEYICDYNIRRNVSYLTFHFYLGKEEEILTDKEKFFDQRYFYIGLCLPRKCINATKVLYREEKVLNICHEVGLSNFKLYDNEDVVKMSTQITGIYYVIIIIYISLNAVKFVVGILRVIFINKGYEWLYAEKFKKPEKYSDNRSYSSDATYSLNESLSGSSNNSQKSGSSSISRQSSYNIDINENIVSEGENLFNPISDNEKHFPSFLKIMKIFDLFDNIKILSTNSNKYYSSQRIKSLYILRFFLMLMIIVHQFMYTQIYLPTKNFYNIEFYSSYGFTFIKFCTNASIFWITLDAVIFGYKLMSYLKKEIKLSKTFKINYLPFIKYLLLTIPKIFTFIFAFFLLHIYSSELTFELCKGNNVFSNYLYYNDTVQQLTYSVRNKNKAADVFKNFIPFRLNYIDFIENVTIEHFPDNISTMVSDTSGYELPSPFLKNTDLFVNVCFNEFYLIILIIIIAYVSYVLQNKIFDLIILIINTILFIFPAIEVFNPHKGNFADQDYRLQNALGQNYSEKYTHYFINFFYFGFLLGVMKFYHEQNIYNNKKKKNSFSQIKLPFEFCNIVITYLSGLKFYIKRTILLCALFLIFFNANSFYIMLGKGISYDVEIKFPKMTGFVKFLFFYEKNISGLLFFIFLSMYIIYPKNTYIMKIAESSTFIIIERISFCFLTSFNYLIYAQFCVFLISIQMTYSNLVFNTIGMFFIIFIFSLMNTALFELPMRQLIKYLMNRKLEDKFNEFYKNKYSSSSSGSDEISSHTS